MSKKAIREAFKSLLVAESVLAEPKILLSKFDRINANSLPVARIYPASGSGERVAVDSYEDGYTLTIEVEARHTSAKAVDDALEDLADAIITAVRNGSSTLNGLLHDYQAVSSRYLFDVETGDEIASVAIDVDCLLKP